MNEYRLAYLFNVSACLYYCALWSKGTLTNYYFIVNFYHHYMTNLQALPLLNNFSNFFTDKISKLHISLTSNTSTSSPHSPSPPTEPSRFSSFRPVSESEISKILINCPNKQSDSDPIPIWLLKVCASVLTPIIQISSIYRWPRVISYSQRICYLSTS